VYREAGGTENPFNVKELYKEEFEALVARHFPASRLLGQKLLFHSAIWSLQGQDGTQLQTFAGGRAIAHDQPAHAAMYLLALCAAEQQALPALEAGLWLFDDAAQAVYSHYQGEIRRNMKAGGIIAERDAEIAALQAQLDEAGSTPKSWLDRLFRR
jgi:hypothetical protein